MTATRTKITFTGGGGEQLAGLLETPATPARAVALFAHCFTCGKDIVAASRIARALVAHGLAVMRFDFTGLGGSDGDFANTNFSSNVQDLVAAANYLREHGTPPTLLIGHSLGGTAVLKAAHQIAESRAVVTIGSPAGAEHVIRQFACDVPQIRAQGEAEVSLAGRRFVIREQFLDDIAEKKQDAVGRLNKALLIFHSPVDEIVPIREAEKIYHAARHPKSFISLAGADHLLSRKHQADYVAANIAAWAGHLLADRA